MSLSDLNWTQGHLNDSAYRAFCQLAGRVLGLHAQELARAVREVAGRIEGAGDTVDAGKLVGQIGDAFAFVQVTAFPDEPGDVVKIVDDYPDKAARERMFAIIETLACPDFCTWAA